MIRRTYVEKKEGFDHESDALKKDLETGLGIRCTRVRIVNRYDVENITEELFEKAVDTVFAEKAVDTVHDRLPDAEHSFAVCPLPGQFDMRSQSAAECLSFLDPQCKATVKAAKVYLIDGVSDEEVERIKKYVINPVEAMEDSLDEVDTLEREYGTPEDIETLEGFTGLDRKGLEDLVSSLSLAMDTDDLECLQNHFKSIGREPTMTEVRVCDTYWSDHCRHTTFLTELDTVVFEHEAAKRTWQKYIEIREELGISKPVSLMDIATIGAKKLKKDGLASQIDESEEINACSINVKASFEDGTKEDYLLMFKNETHNHPTEIEPFGGAATCIGGAIRDPLSGRAYVYQAMRLSGCGDVHTPFDRTLEGKLPQKKIATTSAQGYSSYGNQIGLATGLVDEFYHPGYTAKHLELGAVVAAVKKENVRRERPRPGDLVILVGGRTGRDGIGGATGSSKSHHSDAIDKSSAEVQKGNAPEERKLQRLFSNPEAQKMIKRCNDFGAGGVSVAVGELAPGLEIDLDRVPKKYQGLDGTELAISESQERMAVVIDSGDLERFLSIAEGENLEATAIARVSEEPVLTMKWRGRTIVSLERSFLDTNGAKKKTDAIVSAPTVWQEEPGDTKKALSSMHFCSRQGLCERFDSTIGAGTVLMPYGGRWQKTPESVMCALLPCQEKRATTASIFSYGFNAEHCQDDPYGGAYESVVESVAKIVASGGSRKGTYLTLQEYFGKTEGNPRRWGGPLAALLGALQAQLDTGCAAIGGKDSMSGTFEHLDVPNTLVSFAIDTCERDKVISRTIKKAGSRIYLLTRNEGEEIAHFLDRAQETIRTAKALSASVVERGRVDVTLAKMCFGNRIGFKSTTEIPRTYETAFIIETDEETDDAILLGFTDDGGHFDDWALEELQKAWEERLEDIYPQHVHQEGRVRSITSESTCQKRHSASTFARPHVLIPVFPGTNCETDTALAFRDAGAECEVFVVNNLDGRHLVESMERFASSLSKSQILFIPGGFSGADEPDGSGKFITAFLRNPHIKEEVERLISTRDGLVGGICNGFQALVKLGLLPYGEFRDMREESPTLTFNTIGRHQSRLAMTRVTSKLSPWLMNYEVGQIQMVPVSHGEGRFVAPEKEIEALISSGQVCTQYTTPDGLASMDISANPNGSMYAIEGICSPDGRVFGRMGHVERCQLGLYRNVETSTSRPFFSGAVKYFS